MIAATPQNSDTSYYPYRVTTVVTGESTTIYVEHGRNTAETTETACDILLPQQPPAYEEPDTESPAECHFVVVWDLPSLRPYPVRRPCCGVQCDAQLPRPPPAVLPQRMGRHWKLCAKYDCSRQGGAAPQRSPGSIP